VTAPLIIRRDATIDPTGRYRFALRRHWGDPDMSPSLSSGRIVCWIMLNPSTADALEDDPTIRRCIRFSRAWGYSGLVVVNLFALRATNPMELWRYPATDSIGPGNDDVIAEEARFAQIVIAAWGVNGTLFGRAHAVQQLLRRESATVDVHHLGLTRAGHPKHPLYLAVGTKPVHWEIAA
jgi:hypothetical protein